MLANTGICTYIYKCVYVSIYLSICISISLSLCIYIYTHTYIDRFKPASPKRIPSASNKTKQTKSLQKLKRFKKKVQTSPSYIIRFKPNKSLPPPSPFRLYICSYIISYLRHSAYSSPIFRHSASPFRLYFAIPDI